MRLFLATVLVAATTLFSNVLGHGYMTSPVMRGTMWRYPSQFPLLRRPANYNDNGLRAGGPQVVRANYPAQHRYGMCGDVYTAARPRAHESGGTYGRFPSLGKDAVAACYTPGADIDIVIKITAHHKGFFEYNLCVPGSGRDETEQCFDNGYKLQRADGSGTRYDLPNLGARDYTMRYKLPEGVTCDGQSRCVLRWYWETGNTPGLMKEVS